MTESLIFAHFLLQKCSYSMWHGTNFKSSSSVHIFPWTKRSLCAHKYHQSIRLLSWFCFFSSLALVVTLSLTLSIIFTFTKLKCDLLKEKLMSYYWKKNKISDKIGCSLPILSFMWLLYCLDPLLPCELAQVCILTGLLKLLPCYPIWQDWTPSQNTPGKIYDDKEQFVCFSIHSSPQIFLIPYPVLVLTKIKS